MLFRFLFTVAVPQNPETDLTDDQRLWKAFQAGDQSAYTQLYQFHIRAMFRYGITLVPASEAFVLDCIHDVFTELWAKRERLALPEQVRFYLLKSLKTRILHLLERKEKAYKPLSEVSDAFFESNDLEILEELEAATSRQERLKRLIAQLPHRQQEAIKLRFVENLDYQQIGQILEVNTQSAKNLVFRAVEKLRRWVLLGLCYFFDIFFV